MSINVSIKYIEGSFMKGLSIAKPALDLLAERLDDARAFEGDTSGSTAKKERISMPALIERHGRLETAVMCAAVENVACAFLLRDHGVRGAINRTLPLLSTRARDTFDGACEFFIDRAHAFVDTAVKTLDKNIEAATATSAVVHAGVEVVDSGMRSILGEAYVENAREYIKALPVRAVEYSKVKAVEVYVPCKVRIDTMRKHSRIASVLFDNASQLSFFGIAGASSFFAFTHVYAISLDRGRAPFSASVTAAKAPVYNCVLPSFDSSSVAVAPVPQLAFASNFVEFVNGANVDIDNSTIGSSDDDQTNSEDTGNESSLLIFSDNEWDISAMYTSFNEDTLEVGIKVESEMLAEDVTLVDHACVGLEDKVDGMVVVEENHAVLEDSINSQNGIGTLAASGNIGNVDARSSTGTSTSANATTDTITTIDSDVVIITRCTSGIDEHADHSTDIESKRKDATTIDAETLEILLAVDVGVDSEQSGPDSEHEMVVDNVNAMFFVDRHCAQAETLSLAEKDGAESKDDSLALNIKTEKETITLETATAHFITQEENMHEAVPHIEKIEDIDKREQDYNTVEVGDCEPLHVPSFSVSTPCLGSVSISASIMETLSLVTSISDDGRLIGAMGSLATTMLPMQQNTPLMAGEPQGRNKSEAPKALSGEMKDTEAKEGGVGQGLAPTAVTNRSGSSATPSETTKPVPSRSSLVATATPFVPRAQLKSTQNGAENNTLKPAHWEPARQITPVTIEAAPKSQRRRTTTSSGRRARHLAHMGQSTKDKPRTQGSHDADT